MWGKLSQRNVIVESHIFVPCFDTNLIPDKSVCILSIVYMWLVCNSTPRLKHKYSTRYLIIPWKRDSILLSDGCLLRWRCKGVSLKHYFAREWWLIIQNPMVAGHACISFIIQTCTGQFCSLLLHVLTVHP